MNKIIITTILAFSVNVSAVLVIILCSIYGNKPAVTGPLDAVDVNEGHYLPDFSGFKSVAEKKQAFFDFLYPLVTKANQEVQEQRQILLSFDPMQAISTDIEKICLQYSKDCSIINPLKIKQLLVRVDVIPPSLALAQAANESGWGTSRFAKDAYNFYGQWCFKQGCGLIPSSRSGQAKHEVRKFSSPFDSVKAYIFNLNTHRTYQQLRILRLEAREKRGLVTGLDLTPGLGTYSERGQDYINELQNMINHNGLIRDYDKSDAIKFEANAK